MEKKERERCREMKRILSLSYCCGGVGGCGGGDDGILIPLLKSSNGQHERVGANQYTRDETLRAQPQSSFSRTSAIKKRKKTTKKRRRIRRRALIKKRSDVISQRPYNDQTIHLLDNCCYKRRQVIAKKRKELVLLGSSSSSAASMMSAQKIEQQMRLRKPNGRPNMTHVNTGLPYHIPATAVFAS